MFVLNRKQFVNHEMSKYINTQTNKWLQKLDELYSNKSMECTKISVSDLVKDTSMVSKLPNTNLIISIVSLISFLAGYKFCNVFNK